MNWLIYVLGGWFWFLLIAQIVIIIITIVLATSKGYSGILAFLLGLFIPLLGSLIIVALLPDQNIGYSSGGNRKVNLPKKKCKKCNREIDGDYTACPHCGNNTFEALEGISVSASRTIVGSKMQKKCSRCKREIDEDYTACPHCGNDTFE